ncbi:MAG: hypothetical protein KJ000_33830 [Pirellulaceae bacterium]|nr:hypothetical protein [Pirellulaceae bacterium]
MVVRWSSLSVVLFLACSGSPAAACSMCPVVRDTLSEKLAQAELAVVAELESVQRPAGPGERASSPPALFEKRLARFRVLRLLGEGALDGVGTCVDLLCRTQASTGTTFLLLGSGGREPEWSEPIELSAAALDYLDLLRELPSVSAERLALLLPYTNSPDDLVAADAYAELARAPYADYVAMRTQLDPHWLIARIQAADTKTHCRILYLMLLSACGTVEDAQRLAELLRQRNQAQQPVLHAAIACYLRLAGAEGIALVEDLFLKDRTVEWTDAYAAIVAIRYCGEEFDNVPRPRLAAALHHLLTRPRLAEHVLADLARWGDWSVVERLPNLFREASGDDRSVRVAIVQYLHVCPLPEAKVQLETLRQYDPQSVRAAESWYGLGAVAASETSHVSSDGQTAVSKRTVPATDTASLRNEFGASTAVRWLMLGGAAILVCLLAAGGVVRSPVAKEPGL